MQKLLMLMEAFNVQTHLLTRTHTCTQGFELDVTALSLMMQNTIVQGGCTGHKCVGAGFTCLLHRCLFFK